MALVNLAAAAELLGLSQSSLRRRMSVLDVERSYDADGHVLVDWQDVRRRWEERQQLRRNSRRTKSAPLSIVLEEEMRDEIDQIAETHRLSVGETGRRLLHQGLVRYYEKGKTL